MLIPLGAKGSHSLLSLCGLRVGAGRWRAQFKQSPCGSPHERPAGPGRVKATCSGSGCAVWRPGHGVHSLGAVASTSPALRGHQGSPPEKPQGSPALGRACPRSYAAPRLAWSLGTREQVPCHRERPRGQDHQEIVPGATGKFNVFGGRNSQNTSLR